jgi:ribonucleoside-triphosphate reductase
MSEVPYSLLDKDYLKEFSDFPEHMNALGKFVYLRTYSRFLDKFDRRETLKETHKRSTEYNVSLAIKHLERMRIPVDYEWHKKEAQLLFSNQFNLRQALSGRTLWVGGAESGVAEKFPLANFNCSYTNIEKWEDLAELFYLLLVGTGVGFKATKEMAANLKPIRDDIEIIHEEYKPKPKNERLERTEVTVVPEHATAYIEIGDSKEGWVQALRVFFNLMTSEELRPLKTISVNYNSIRPRGERLETFGGTASGPDPMKEMFDGFIRVIKNQVDTTLSPLERVDEQFVKVRPIHILDMGNMIGNNVVVGGVRRTAEIFLFDDDDYECLFAKYGVNGFWKEEDFKKHESLVEYLDSIGFKYPEWFKKIGERHYDEKVNIDFVTKEPRREADGSLSPFNFGTGFYHRAMSNNSIGFIKKPSKKFLRTVFKIMKTEGEPGFVNLYEAARRRLARMGIYNPKLIEQYAVLIGLNPCAEILLQSKGVCNLTTVNVMAFVYFSDGKWHLDRKGLIQAQELSARAGLRMTLAELELEEWNRVQQQDRLCGTSLTGVYDAMDLLGWGEEELQDLLSELSRVARTEADNYAKQLRIPCPLLVTTVKPEGTLSQVFGGVSSGLHRSHSEYFIRRVRINADDPLAKAVLQHKTWTVNPENGTPGKTYEEKMANAKTYVIDFPVFAGAKTTKYDVTVEQQFETYFMFQEEYTEHNSSNTITIDDSKGEWEKACDIVYDNWDNFVGVSFLALDGGTYQLPPYEAITKEQYDELVSKMEPFDMSILQKFDSKEGSSLDGMDGCEGGVCPIR